MACAYRFAGSNRARATAATVLQELMSVLTPTSRRAMMRVSWSHVKPAAGSVEALAVRKWGRRPMQGSEPCGGVPKRSSPLARLSWKPPAAPADEAEGDAS